MTELKKTIWKALDYINAILGIVAFFSIVVYIGFDLGTTEEKALNLLIWFVIFAFILTEGFRFLLVNKIKSYLSERWFENLLLLFLILCIILFDLTFDFLHGIIPDITIREVYILNIGLIQFLIILIIVIKALRYNYLISRIKLHPAAIFALSFAVIIFSGTVALQLPRAATPGKSITLVDALFTSTSAVCVTGLTVLDTAGDFSTLGKIIILMLIQIGGLGVMTLTTFFAVFLTGGMSFGVRLMMKDFLSQENLTEVSNLLLKITLFTVSIELMGAVLLYISLGGSFTKPAYNYIGSAVFHSVSAFCNAGFSIYHENLADNSLLTNHIFFSLIMLLIVLGGLGFTVLSELFTLRHFRRGTKLSVSTKLVLSTTFFLIAVASLLLFIIEPFNTGQTLNAAERFFNCLFLSVTPRTAGFNIVKTELLTPATAIILIVLMWIGASPGSTGGGIKTTTFATAVLSMLNNIKGKDRLELFRRRISEESIKKAFMVIFMSLLVLALSIVILVIIEPDKSPLDLSFEAVSAIGTVGLSRNITAFLGTGGKVVIILLMYVGRIGVLNFFMAFFKPSAEAPYSLPKVNVMIG